MRFFKDRDDTHIILEGFEEERAVLRAIVKASFDLAHPVGLSAVDYRPEYCLSDAEADQWIRSAPRSHDSRIVDMDFVQGRQCKTVLFKETFRHFRLDTKFFERYRGNCVPMLELAQCLLSETCVTQSQNGSSPSTDLRAIAAAK